MQNPECVSELELNINPLPMQSTAVAELVPAEPIPFDESEDLWGVWPYCWAIDLYEVARESFHSFHEKHSQWKLARYNRRAQAEEVSSDVVVITRNFHLHTVLGPALAVRAVMDGHDVTIVLDAQVQAAAAPPRAARRDARAHSDA